MLDLIQVFVEALDKVFENVCELDLVFGFDEVRLPPPPPSLFSHSCRIELLNSFFGGRVWLGVGPSYIGRDHPRRFGLGNQHFHHLSKRYTPCHSLNPLFLSFCGKHEDWTDPLHKPNSDVEGGSTTTIERLDTELGELIDRRSRSGSTASFES